MTTLLVSDLHLGARLAHDVLRRPAPRGALLDALDEIDRLVLLGDVVEMLEGRPKAALRIAEPVLHAIGHAMRGRDVVVVAGNHDHLMLRPWLRARARAHRSLGLATRVPMSSSPLLARVARALRPARVQVRYPGVWIADRVYATHGHYLDRHLLPEGSIGLPRGLVGRTPGPGSRAWDYEHAAGASPAAFSGLLATALPLVGEPIDRAAGLARRSMSAVVPRAAALIGETHLAPLNAGVLGLQFRRSGLPAMARVAENLAVRADVVIFGHLHRSGPRPGDDIGEWRPGDGRRTFVNTGAWVHESLLVAGVTPPHPYWPGGAVLVEDGRAPRALGLLDGLDAEQLAPDAKRTSF